MSTSGEQDLHLKVVMPSDPRYLPVVRGAVGPLPASCWRQSNDSAEPFQPRTTSR